MSQISYTSRLTVPATAVERLQALRGLGLRIAIDDFGTGYASFQYLQTLPIDILKIDRSFISGDALRPDQRKAFLGAIIGLAKSLHLSSTAEGVEELDQLDELTSLGCDIGQGYIWSAATPLANVLASIEHIESARQAPVLA